MIVLVLVEIEVWKVKDYAKPVRVDQRGAY